MVALLQGDGKGNHSFMTKLSHNGRKVACDVLFTHTRLMDSCHEANPTTHRSGVPQDVQ